MARVSKFIAALLSLEKPDKNSTEGDDLRAIKIDALPNHVVVGLKEYKNAIQIKTKEKQVDSDRW